MSIYKSMGDEGRYPDVPGYKARDTARSAAAAFVPTAKPLRERIMDELRLAPATPEEVAERLDEPVMNCRPRFSELATRGRIRDSGVRRRAMGGRKAIVWEIVRDAT